ncbi:MAG: HD domain-containing phosphohydrolase [Candidatus Izemoplasmatales bacterium]
MDFLIEIVSNILFLFGIIAMISLFDFSTKPKRPWLSTLLIGLGVGLITIILMLTGFTTSTGAHYDIRSIFISVTTLYFSPISVLIAVVMSSLYRIYMGGIGTMAGVSTLVLSYLIGLAWRKYKRPSKRVHPHFEYYLFGLIIQIAMLLSQLWIPYPTNIEIISSIFLPVMIIYPIITVFLSMAFMNYKKRILSMEILREFELKYRTLIDSAHIGVIEYDLTGKILVANKAFYTILNATPEDLFLFDMHRLPNKELIDLVDRSLQGEITIYENHYTCYFSNKTFPARIQFTPIYIHGRVQGGFGIVEDLTFQYSMTEQIVKLSERDILTTLYNRITFDNDVLNSVPVSNFPIAFITADINSLNVINASFGYEEGNRVIQKVAAILLQTKEVLHNNIYRIGGDQFALLIPDFPEEETIHLIEQIKKQIALIKVADISISISFGYDIILSPAQSYQASFEIAMNHLHENKIYDNSSYSAKTVDMIISALFAKSKREKLHSDRVSEIAYLIAKEFHLGTSFENRVRVAGVLHDIGKITISEEILNKPNDLTKEERLKINKHSEAGFKILSSVPEYYELATIILFHHERYDGKGYPRKISGHTIPLASRIISVADSFDAMTQSRPYRKALTKQEAIDEINRCSNLQFDPEVVDKFILLYDQGLL